MAKVSFQRIKKNFGSVEIMKDISLEINDKEFVVLLGSSGCGKTTLLRMLAGLETVSDGDILIDDRRVNDIHPRNRDITMVFQNYALYPTMKVFDNIGFSLEVAKKPKAEIKMKVEEVARTLNLTDFLHRYPKELSGGQRQRVAMGRAMVRNAKVFLFDEPLSNLDAKLRAHMRVEIRSLHDRLGTTSIYVTHDQIEAMTMADRVVLMKGGKIIQQGSPDELYDKPNDVYVADFIGTPSMNFIQGNIQSENEGFAFVGEEIQIPVSGFSGILPNQSVLCGIRPSDLRIMEEGTIIGHVLMEEKTGADNLLHFKVGETDFTAVVPRNTPIPENKIIQLGVSSDRIHLFNPETRKRLN